MLDHLQDQLLRSAKIAIKKLSTVSSLNYGPLFSYFPSLSEETEQSSLSSAATQSSSFQKDFFPDYEQATSLAQLFAFPFTMKLPGDGDLVTWFIAECDVILKSQESPLPLPVACYYQYYLLPILLGLRYVASTQSETHELKKARFAAIDNKLFECLLLVQVDKQYGVPLFKDNILSDEMMAEMYAYCDALPPDTYQAGLSGFHPDLAAEFNNDNLRGRLQHLLATWFSGRCLAAEVDNLSKSSSFFNALILKFLTTKQFHYLKVAVESVARELNTIGLWNTFFTSNNASESTPGRPEHNTTDAAKRWNQLFSLLNSVVQAAGNSSVYFSSWLSATDSSSTVLNTFSSIIGTLVNAFDLNKKSQQEQMLTFFHELILQCINNTDYIKTINTLIHGYINSKKIASSNLLFMLILMDLNYQVTLCGLANPLFEENTNQIFLLQENTYKKFKTKIDSAQQIDILYWEVTSQRSPENAWIVPQSALAVFLRHLEDKSFITVLENIFGSALARSKIKNVELTEIDKQAAVFAQQLLLLFQTNSNDLAKKIDIMQRIYNSLTERPRFTINIEAASWIKDILVEMEVEQAGSVESASEHTPALSQTQSMVFPSTTRSMEYEDSSRRASYSSSSNVASRTAQRSHTIADATRSVASSSSPSLPGDFFHRGSSLAAAASSPALSLSAAPAIIKQTSLVPYVSSLSTPSYPALALDARVVQDSSRFILSADYANIIPIKYKELIKKNNQGSSLRNKQLLAQDILIKKRSEASGKKTVLLEWMQQWIAKTIQHQADIQHLFTNSGDFSEINEKIFREQTNNLICEYGFLYGQLCQFHKDYLFVIKQKDYSLDVSIHITKLIAALNQFLLNVIGKIKIGLEQMESARQSLKDANFLNPSLILENLIFSLTEKESRVVFLLSELHALHYVAGLELWDVALKNNVKSFNDIYFLDEVNSNTTTQELAENIITKASETKKALREYKKLYESNKNENLSFFEAQKACQENNEELYNLLNTLKQDAKISHELAKFEEELNRYQRRYYGCDDEVKGVLSRIKETYEERARLYFSTAASLRESQQNLATLISEDPSWLSQTGIDTAILQAEKVENAAYQTIERIEKALRDLNALTEIVFLLKSQKNSFLSIVQAFDNLHPRIMEAVSQIQHNVKEEKIQDEVFNQQSELLRLCSSSIAVLFSALKEVDGSGLTEVHHTISPRQSTEHDILAVFNAAKTKLFAELQRALPPNQQVTSLQTDNPPSSSSVSISNALVEQGLNSMLDFSSIYFAWYALLRDSILNSLRELTGFEALFCHSTVPTISQISQVLQEEIKSVSPVSNTTPYIRSILMVVASALKKLVFAQNARLKASEEYAKQNETNLDDYNRLTQLSLISRNNANVLSITNEMMDVMTYVEKLYQSYIEMATYRSRIDQRTASLLNALDACRSAIIYVNFLLQKSNEKSVASHVGKDNADSTLLASNGDLSVDVQLSIKPHQAITTTAVVSIADDDEQKLVITVLTKEYTATIDTTGLRVKTHVQDSDLSHVVSTPTTYILVPTSENTILVKSPNDEAQREESLELAKNMINREFSPNRGSASSTATTPGSAIPSLTSSNSTSSLNLTQRTQRASTSTSTPVPEISAINRRASEKIKNEIKSAKSPGSLLPGQSSPVEHLFFRVSSLLNSATSQSSSRGQSSSPSTSNSSGTQSTNSSPTKSYADSGAATPPTLFRLGSGNSSSPGEPAQADSPNTTKDTGKTMYSSFQ